MNKGSNNWLWSALSESVLDVLETQHIRERDAIRLKSLLQSSIENASDDVLQKAKEVLANRETAPVNNGSVHKQLEELYLYRRRSFEDFMNQRGYVCLPVSKREDATARDVDNKYAPLKAVLDDALNQASKGKGNMRHANELPFREQRMFTIEKRVGSGFIIGQALKKIEESLGMPAAQAYHELLGAIVYTSGRAILLKEQIDFENAASADNFDEEDM